MEKRIFLFTIFAAMLFMTACGDETQEPGVEDPMVAENAEMPTYDQPADTEDAEEQPAATGGTEESGQSLMLLENETVGPYLADSEGMTLYYFTNDEANTSNCSGDCLVNWPAFTAQDFEVPEGFDEKDFGTITREDNGEEQVTFKGYPLYYFINDEQQGDVNGEGLNNAWYIVNNETTFPE